MSRCNMAVRYFSIICLTSCSLVLFVGCCAVGDCPNANENRAMLLARCEIRRFIVEVLYSFIVSGNRRRKLFPVGVIECLQSESITEQLPGMTADLADLNARTEQ